MEEIQVGNINIEIFRKKIKHLHLRVIPPFGKVTISAPKKMNLDIIKIFVLSKIEWIKKHRVKIQSKIPTPKYQYIPGEIHYFLGKKYLLNVIEKNPGQKTVLSEDTITIHTRKNASVKNRKNILYKWYESQLEQIVHKNILELETIINVKPAGVAFKKMKARWGTCNISTKVVTLNTELAKKNTELIKYVLKHEMVHLLEKHHNKKFYAYMDLFEPEWKQKKEALNN